MNDNKYSIIINESDQQIIDTKHILYVGSTIEKNSKFMRRKSLSAPKINNINNKSILALDLKLTQHIRNRDSFEKVWEESLKNY
jgi:hypothetical protein